MPKIFRNVHAEIFSSTLLVVHQGNVSSLPVNSSLASQPLSSAAMHEADTALVLL